MPTTDTAKLYGHWLGMWNGDFDLAANVISAQCVIHHPSAEAATDDNRDGPERMVEVVKQGRAPFTRLVFTLDVGPIEEGDKVAARWTARGSYSGGVPGAHAEAGAAVTFSGIDLCRLADGKIAEYWGCSDALQLMQQLGAVPEK